MGKLQGSDSKVEVAIGYACDARGNGVAYARVIGAKIRPLRVSFRTLEPRASERAAAYSAVTVVARTLWRRGLRHASFVLADSQFVDEIGGRSELPDALALPYVRLRCVLNSFGAFDVRAGMTDELTQRARAEVALNLAA